MSSWQSEMTPEDWERVFTIWEGEEDLLHKLLNKMWNIHKEEHKWKNLKEWNVFTIG